MTKFRDYLATQNPYFERNDELVLLFDEATKRLPKFPRIWILKLEFLESNFRFKEVIDTISKALQNLVITQHELIWDFALRFVRKCPGQIGKVFYEKYTELKPEAKDDFIDFLEETKQFSAGFSLVSEMIADEDSRSRRSHYELSMKMVKFAALGAAQIPSELTDRAFRSVLNKYSDEIGNVWIFFADSFIRRGEFEKARATFEKGLRGVMSLRDFQTVFNGYLKFEEEILNITQTLEEGLEEEEAEKFDEIDRFLGLSSTRDDPRVSSLEEQILRVERIIEHRNVWKAECSLRQNRFLVSNWTERMNLHAKNSAEYRKIGFEALEALVPSRSEGNVAELWISMATGYAKESLEMMNRIFERALFMEFRPGDLVLILRSWAETLIELGFLDDARTILSKALFDSQFKCQSKGALQESAILRGLLLDLSYNLDESTVLIANYRRLIEGKAFTPEQGIRFLQLLEAENKQDEMLSAFERLVEMVSWPEVKHIWVWYLNFIESRFAKIDIEFVRDTYDSVLSKAPREHCKLTRSSLLFHVCEIRV